MSSVPWYHQEECDYDDAPLSETEPAPVPPAAPKPTSGFKSFSMKSAAQKLEDAKSGRVKPAPPPSTPPPSTPPKPPAMAQKEKEKEASDEKLAVLEKTLEALKAAKQEAAAARQAEQHWRNEVARLTDQNARLQVERDSAREDLAAARRQLQQAANSGSRRQTDYSDL